MRNAASACSSVKLWVNTFRSGTLRSTAKRAHSASNTVLKVHEPYMVSCLWITSGVISNVAVPCSPTKHARPQARAAFAQLARASEWPVQSSVASAPSPWVSSRIASTGEPSVLSMAAVGAETQPSRAVHTHRRVARAAVLAHAAAPVVVHHHALAQWRLELADARTAFGDHAAWLVTGDEC